MNKEQLREIREELKRELVAQIEAVFEKEHNRVTVDTSTYLVKTPDYGKIYFPNAG